MATTETAELLAKAMRLPADQRLEIATELLDSVEASADPEWTTAWASEVERRTKELEAGTAVTVPWERVKSEILTRLRSR